MKVDHVVLRAVMLVVISSFFLSPAVAEEGAPPREEKNYRGAFIEAGPAFRLAFAGDEKLGPFLGILREDVDEGWGFQIGAGYDWTALGIRGNFRWSQLEVDQTSTISSFYRKLDIDYFSFGGDLKVYLLELGGVTHSPVRPYLIAGGGIEIVNGTLDSDTFGVYNDAIGFGGNFGLGLAFHPIEHFYINVENTVRPAVYLEEDFCLYGFNLGFCDSTYAQYSYNLAVNLGVHF